MTTYEKIVKGATKVKVAAPKPKYIEPILMATSIDHSGVSRENFNTIMRTLQSRLHDSSWSVVYKSLIVIHLMIREGDKDVTLDFLVNKASPNMLNLSHNNVIKNSNSFNNDIKFINKYSKYLQTRVKQFDMTGIDYVRDERSNNSSDQQGGRLRTLTVDKGLLREVESVQKQIDSLLKNNFMENEINNDIILTAFRLLVNDLLALFQELNEGVINILEHYFEMYKADAERSLKIYKKFVDQTKFVIDYLRVAKHLEYATKLHVPTIKHAPTALTSSLEEYLEDPNFEMNRRQYLLEKGNKDVKETKPPIFNTTNNNNGNPQNNEKSDLKRQNSLVVQQTYNPWSAMIIPVVGIVDPNQGQQEAQLQAQHQQAQIQQAQLQQAQIQQAQLQQAQLQQAQLQQAQLQQAQLQQAQLQQAQLQNQHTGFTPLPSIIQGQELQSPTIQSTFTGVGFGGYGPQQQQQQLQPQHTNPFVQQQQQQQPVPPQFGLQRSNTNPFANAQQQQQQQFIQPVQQQFTQPPQQPLQPQSTNPFANTRFASSSHTTAFTVDNGSSQQPQKPIQATATGNNPFKVSQTTSQLFDEYSKNQQQSSQLKPQPTAGGLEHVPTIPVFPETQRAAQQDYYFQNAQTGLYAQAFPQQQTQFATGIHQQMPIQQQYTNYDGPSLI
ncbi:SPBC19F8.03c ENTH domain-containing protein C19F8.03c [Candida maltosa Xu316]